MSKTSLKLKNLKIYFITTFTVRQEKLPTISNNTPSSVISNFVYIVYSLFIAFYIKNTPNEGAVTKRTKQNNRQIQLIAFHLLYTVIRSAWSAQN